MNNQAGFMKDDCLRVQHEYRKGGEKKTITKPNSMIVPAKKSMCTSGTQHRLLAWDSVGLEWGPKFHF